jgi:hypothetical protein
MAPRVAIILSFLVGARAGLNLPLCTPGCCVKLGHGVKCGFRKGWDCPRPFTIAELEASARKWDPTNHTQLTAMESASAVAANECRKNKKGFTSIGTGGYCNLVKRDKSHYSKSQYNSNNPTVQKLKEYLASRNAAGAPSVIEFGAGNGYLGRALLSVYPGLDYRGYDAAGDIANSSEGFIQYADVGTEFSLPPADWVFSQEMGEHIHRKFEKFVIRNLHVHACKGIILSWATLNQGGYGHVNVHSPEYLANVFSDLGYSVKIGLGRLLLKEAPMREGLDWASVNDSFVVATRLRIPDYCSNPWPFVASRVIENYKLNHFV